MMLRVQQYDLIVKYTPGDQLHVADTLSRASQSESTSQADEFEVHLLVQISKEKADEFKRETDSDPVLSMYPCITENDFIVLNDIEH